MNKYNDGWLEMIHRWVRNVRGKKWVNLNLAAHKRKQITSKKDQERQMKYLVRLLINKSEDKWLVFCYQKISLCEAVYNALNSSRQLVPSLGTELTIKINMKGIEE